MSWRDTIKPDKPLRTWRDTIKPDPFVVQGIDGKDFEWSEHESKIYGLIKKYIDSIKKELFESLKAAFKPELEKLRPKDGKSIKGDKGDQGPKGADWLLYELQPDSSDGLDGDLALAKQTGELFKKIQGQWESQGFFGKKQQAPLMVGGITEQFVIDYVAANGGGGGGPTTQNIEQTNSNITITDQDILVCKAGCTAIALKSVASATKKVMIKNRTGGDITITVDGGANIDDDTGFVMYNNTAYEFVPQGSQYYVY